MATQEVATFEFTAMATPCRIRLAGLTRPLAERLAEAAVAEVRRIERHWSRYRPDSLVSRINAAAGEATPVAVDAETAALFDFGALLHAQTAGAFDLTSGAWRRAWDFRRAGPAPRQTGTQPGPSLPTATQLDALRPLVGWSQVDWDGRSLRLPRAGMEIDLGGLGKEYAVDRAASLLIEGGARSGVVNLGGDLRVLGPMADGTPWRIGVADPRRGNAAADAGPPLYSPTARKAIAFDWPLAEGALATSGGDERCLVIEGRRYGHLLDARSGWPVSYWRSISVAGPSCLAAGALTTAAMLLGEDAADFLAAQGLPWAGLTADGRQVDRRRADPPGR
jgi:thiamine biosynthesis lipoprotein